MPDHLSEDSAFSATSHDPDYRRILLYPPRRCSHTSLPVTPCVGLLLHPSRCVWGGTHDYNPENPARILLLTISCRPVAPACLPVLVCPRVFLYRFP